MCGIVGFFGDGDGEKLAQLTALLAHRGPDAEGFYVDEFLKVYLGHRRLAIRDFAGGAQPMCDPDGRYILTYNGEIFNDKQLRGELELLGHVFSSDSDTEVVLRAMIEWRESAPEKFDGQFAFCFVDRAKKQVLLARDRFGEKPLYWARTLRGLVFASESNVVANHLGVVPELSEENCIRFLIMGYLPPPFSILKGVRQLLPGHILTFSISDEIDPSEKLFAYPWDAFKNQIKSKEHSVGVETINRAVASRRVSDVPVGVLLSGGVDSSLVALSAARIGWRPETFTIGFEDESYDESRFAAETARELGLNNYQMHMSAESWESVQDILKLLDEPLGDSSFLPTYSVFKLASSKSKVLLSGDGGDELFFGYEPFRILQLSNVIQRVIPALARRLTSSFLSFLPRTSSYMNRIDIAERLLDGVSYSGVNRVLVWMATLRVREWKRFFPKSGSPEAMFEFSDSLSEIEDFGEAVRRLFLLSYLPGNVLMKSDRASMSNSVEARTIFFHPEIVNFALTQTLGQEMRGGKGKQSLRRIARESGLIKVAARKKHGFALPVAEVLRNPKITAPQIDLPGIEQREVDQEWLKLQAGRPARVQFLWAALSLVNSRSYRLVKHFEGSSAGGH